MKKIGKKVSDENINKINDMVTKYKASIKVEKLNPKV